MAQRLSAWYFWYFAFVGAFQPYFALYLQSIGLSAGRIAVLMSLGQFMRLLAPLLWSWLADSGGHRVRIVVVSTAAGAVGSMVTGTVSAILLIFLSPTIQVDILKHQDALFPLKNPAIVTMTLSFVVGIAVSILKPEPSAEAKFAEVADRMHLGPDSYEVPTRESSEEEKVVVPAATTDS